ncbi:MAG: hypothetical protein HYS27_13730 [Deltaproteobacteria bacterium]|nr:hypothetical protein [Deltaproteobacteria bacterium]
MKTCSNDPRVAHHHNVVRRTSADLERVAGEALVSRIDADRFVRTSVRVEDLHLRIDGPGLSPMPPSQGNRCGHGFAQGVGGGDVAAAQRARLDEVAKLAGALAELKADYRAWRLENPNAVEPGNGTRSLGEILDDPSLSTGDMCIDIVEVIFHERPEAADELRATIPNGEIPAERQAPDAGSTGSSPGSNTDISRGIFSAFGMGANLLGGLLSSPLAIPLLTAACAVIPGAQVIAPFIPVIAPIAGMALSGVGGMASHVGQGQAPGLDPSSLASPDMLAQLLPAITGTLGGGAATNAAAPAAPLPVPAT